jgi:hypothetical protein
MLVYTTNLWHPLAIGGPARFLATGRPGYRGRASSELHLASAPEVMSDTSPAKQRKPRTAAERGCPQQSNIG